MAGSAPSCQPRNSVAGNTFASIGGRIARNVSAGLALGLPLAITWAQPAQAVLIYNFYESGGNLVIEGTGSLNLPSSPITSGGLGASTGSLELDGAFLTGINNPTTQLGFYFITGPATLGASIFTTNAASSSDSGISSAIIYNSSNPFGSGVFLIEDTYRSGASIFSRSTFTGKTLASLGMPNSGTLGTWTLDGSGDTISVQVNASRSSASVPGPLPILGLAAVFGFSRKLRKRINLHKDTGDTSTSPGA